MGPVELSHQYNTTIREFAGEVFRLPAAVAAAE
jgi:hypothetical protein